MYYVAECTICILVLPLVTKMWKVRRVLKLFVNYLIKISWSSSSMCAAWSKVGKVHPVYRHWGSVQAVRPTGGVELWLYPFMTTALEGDEGSASRPGRSLPPGKTRYPLYRRLGGPQDRSGQVRKISFAPPDWDPRTFQPVASHYTDYATRPTAWSKKWFLIDARQGSERA